MPYAADSIRVQQFVPFPSGSMSLSAATRLGLLSLRGTGSQERVQVECRPGEKWFITVSDPLGFISVQDDIDGARTLYGRPAIEQTLLALDRTENELRRFLPVRCFLLSLFSCLRREISWLLPTATDPSAVKSVYLRRFCEMLFQDRFASEFFAWFHKYAKSHDELGLVIATKTLLPNFQYPPSEASLRALCSVVAKGQPVQPAVTECIKSMQSEHPYVSPVENFRPSIETLQLLADSFQETIAQQQLSSAQQLGIINTLCNAAEIPPYRFPDVSDLLAHAVQVDIQNFYDNPPVAHIRRYAMNYVRGEQAKMKHDYRVILPGLQSTYGP
jgi:hypothetical protein